MAEIQWIDLNRFNEVLKTKYDKNNIFLEEKVSFELTFSDLDPILTATPYYSETEDIGKTVTWFAEVDGMLFYIMNFYESPFPKTILGAASFEILASLDSLAPIFFKHITWINNYPENAQFSVFSTNSNGLKVEVYRAENFEEADTTAYFLNHRAKSQNFYVDNSDDLNKKWLVKEKKADNSIVEIGRYADRLSAEQFVYDYHRNEKKDIFIESE